jgi:methylated-DNA-[protein]-cysteine S-methyltransferase
MKGKIRYWTTMKTPVGEVFIAGLDGKLTELRFGRPKKGFPGPGWKKSDAEFREVKRQLGEYFRGERKKFDLKLAPEGTPFQLAAWKQLRRIPYGKTISYGEQARRMGNPKAARAAGAANRENPISIIVPCHRVIGADGKLTGYGGGLGKKKRLLDLEGAGGPGR